MRLLTSNTAFSELAKMVAQSIPMVEQFVRVAAAYQPVGVLYLMLPEQLVIKQAAATPGGTDWTLGQASLLHHVLLAVQCTLHHLTSWYAHNMEWITAKYHCGIVVFANVELIMVHLAFVWSS